MTNGDALSGIKGRLDVIAESMRDAVTLQVPNCVSLEVSHGVNLRDELQHAAQLVITKSDTNDPLSESELDFFRELGRMRGQEMVPVTGLRAAFEVAFLAGLKELVAVSDGGDSSKLLQVSAYANREYPRMIQAAENSCAASLVQLGEDGNARELLLRNLLRNKPVSAVAEVASVRVSQSYLILLCKIPNPETISSAVQRRATEEILGSIPDTLWKVNRSGGKILAMLPYSDDCEAVWGLAADSIASLSDIFHQRIYVGASHSSRLVDIPRAFQEARQTLHLVIAMPDAQSRPYTANDVLVEKAIVRQPDVQERLVNLLTPLERGTDLRHTLEVLFDCELDREKARKILHIHRRTMTYRLKRIRDLTGIDPNTGHGIQILRTALTSRRLIEYP